MPEPVCQTFKGKFSSNLPLITSSDALIIALEILLSINLSLACTIAADLLIIAIDLIIEILTKLYCYETFKIIVVSNSCRKFA